MLVVPVDRTSCFLSLIEIELLAGDLFGGGCGNLRRLLLRSCRRRAGRLLAWPAACAALAMFPEFLLALQFFIEANGLILDDGVGNFQAPLEFLDQVALRALHHHVNEKAFAVFRNAVRKT